MLTLLPDSLKEVYGTILQEHKHPESHREIIKAADKLSAYLICQSELKSGNEEFTEAAEQLKMSLKQIDLPEVDYFIDKE